MASKRYGLATLIAAALLMAFASSALAQYARAPYFEQTVLQSQAYGLQLAQQRLDALELVGQELGDELDDDYLEIVEGFEEDLPRFMGTLRARDAQLAADVEGAVEELEEAAEAGEPLAAHIAELRPLLEAANDLVIPADVRSDPVFIAALMVDMALGEGGAGEGYEEAVEGELGEYTMGYASLARLDDLWSQISAGASEQQREDVQEMLDEIAALYPTPTIDAPIIGNPEEAEASVQRMIGVLETIVDAELFPGRDLQALAAHLPAELAGACQAYEAGESERALEGVIAVGYLYLEADLGDFLEFMAPEVHDEAAELIAALTGMGGEDDDDEEAEDEDDAPALADPSASCRELMEALQEASAVLGG